MAQRQNADSYSTEGYLKREGDLNQNFMEAVLMFFSSRRGID